MSDQRDKGCVCQGCGGRYRIDFLLPDEVWYRLWIRPPTNGGGLLCGRCIAEGLEALGEFDAFTLTRPGDVPLSGQAGGESSPAGPAAETRPQGPASTLSAAGATP